MSMEEGKAQDEIQAKVGDDTRQEGDAAGEKPTADANAGPAAGPQDGAAGGPAEDGQREAQARNEAVVKGRDEARDAKEEVQPARAAEELVRWVQSTCVFKREWTEAQINQVNSFLVSDRCRRLIAFTDDDGELCVQTGRLAGLEQSNRVQFFVKIPGEDPLTIDNVSRRVLQGVVSGEDTLSSLIKLMEGVYMPTFLANQSWPDSVRKEFTGQLHRFMAGLVEAANQRKGKTVLYIPVEDLSSPSRAALDKALVQRLESTLLRWTKQIKEVVSGSEDAQTGEASGPMQEIVYWQRRDKDLSGIREQLDQPKLTEIVNVLQQANSTYLVNFRNLSSLIHKGSLEAKSNLKFLSPLRAPCTKLAAAEPGDIPELLPGILDLVRMISTLSPFYAEEEKITNLLLKISYQIIAQCRKNVDLELLFGGDVLASMDALKQNIACCGEWRKAYDQSVALIARSNDERKWDKFDHGTIFAQVEAFKKRCQDLIEVCEGQLQFARLYKRTEGKKRAPVPYFGGSSGRTVGKSLYEIEDAFAKHLARLRGLKYDIMDVKSTAWHDDYNTFKDGMGDLEVMMTNVVASAWEGISTVKDGVELLTAFFEIAKRGAMRKSLTARVSSLWGLFSRELKRVKDCFEKDKGMTAMATAFCAPIRRVSRVAGASLWAKGLLTRIQADFACLECADQLPSVREISDAKKMYGTVEALLSGYINYGCYDKWESQVREDEKVKSMADRLKTNLLTRTNVSTEAVLGRSHLLVRDPSGRLECVFDKTLLRISSEVFYWNQYNDVYLGDAVSIPHQARQIAIVNEKIRVLRTLVMQIVRKYNKTREYLTDDEEKLFESHIARLDRYIARGINKLTWPKKDYIKKFVADSQDQCQELFLAVSKFKENEKAIDAVCAKLASTVLVDIVRNRVYHDVEFERTQERARGQLRNKFKKAHASIVQTLEASYKFFANVTLPSVKKEWGKYVRKVDKRIQDALRRSAIVTAQAMSSCINGDPKAQQEVHAMFKLNVLLDGRRVKLEPSTESLIQTIQRVENEALRCISVFPRMIYSLASVTPKATGVQWGEDTKQGETADGKAAPATDGKADGVADPALAKTLPKDAAATAPQQSYVGSRRVMSFYDTIKADTAVVQIIQRTERGIKTTSKKLSLFLRKYDQYSDIWMLDKRKSVQSWSTKRPALSDFIQNIKIKQNNQSTFQNFDPITDIGFVRLDNNPIKQSLVRHCQQWQGEYTRVLHRFASTELIELHTYFDDNTKALSSDPDSLAQLKVKVDTLESIREKKVALPARFEPLEAQYRTLDNFGRRISEDEKDMFDNLRSNWDTFLAMLADAEGRMRRYKANFKKELEDRQAGHLHDVAQMRKRFKSEAPFSTDAKAGEEPDIKSALTYIERIKDTIAGFKKSADDMKTGLSVFKMRELDYPEIEQTEQELALLDKLWSLFNSWYQRFRGWKELKFSTLVVEDLDTQSRLCLNKLKKLFQNPNVKGWGAWFTLEETVKRFKKTLGPVNNLRNPAMRERHWIKLKAEIKRDDFDPYADDFTLGTVLKLGLHKYDAIVQELAMVAVKELAMDKSLKEIKAIWSDMNLELSPYKNDYYKIVGIDTLNETLENHQLLLSTMKNSPYFATFADEITFWIKTLNAVVDSLDASLIVQQQWMYLESIFLGSEHIRKQLPEETRMFKGVHKDWTAVLQGAAKIKNAQQIYTQEGLYPRLQKSIEVLEKIQKNLAQFLAGKRRAFPRFYFLADQDLLEILANARDPLAVQPHINKLFVGIKKIKFEPNRHDPKKSDAVGMSSKDGEYVKFNAPLLIEGEVENWLSQIEKLAADSMRRLTHIALTKYLQRNKKKAHTHEVLSNWIDKNPGQTLITTGQIHWSGRCEECLGAVKAKREMRALKRDWQTYMMYLANQMTGKMPKVRRKKMSALITIEVHAREVIAKLKAAAKQGARADSFEWKKQLRFYFEDSEEYPEWGQVVTRQTNTQFNYQYEYQGNPFRLVITPLTDRCYMTLTTALSLARGGSPMGPAGTGKTETVKDLAKNMAINIYVFNCSDEMSVDGLARIYKGLAQSGAWGCFDEFNRILIEVLSVIAMQIQAVLFAIRDKSKEFPLQGEVIPLNPTVGIFVTMNPGYAGRTELPENLKALFRPVAMMVPDTQAIAEVMLLSQGFREALDLSLKIVTIYDLMKMQLSKQSHYAYGLRAINSVLQCALIIRGNSPNMSERLIIYTSIRNMNLSKMVSEDKVLFENLLNDAFPATEPPKENLGALTGEIRNQLRLANLEPTPLMVGKVVEVYMALNTRHGNMLVGHTMGGKTTAWKVLKAAQDELWRKKIEPEKYQAVDVYLINPKSIKNSEMYGNYDVQTREWTDGILSVNMREACTSSTPNQKWMIMDGPVDTLWIESMNTVLDSNKVLTLVNGDRIALPPQVRMVFEVENLDVASPATVSRAGMVYLSAKDLGWKPYVKSWIRYGSAAIGLYKADEKQRVLDGTNVKVTERKQEVRDLLETFVDKYVEETLEFKRLNCKETVTLSPFAAVKSLCKLFDALSTKENGCNPADKNYTKMMERWFVYCLVWSVCGAVDAQGREKCDKFIRDIADPPYPMTAGATVYEFYVDSKKQDWVLWRTRVNKLWRPKPGTSFFNIYVPTLDTVRYQFLVNTMLKCGAYPLMVGNTGTGKTCCAVNCIGDGSPFPESDYVGLTMNFSAATTSNATQSTLETRLEKRQRGCLGPVGNRERLVVFIDDLNMPRKDEYGSQPPIELLKQWIDNKFWYDRKKQAKKTILGMQLLCAMGPPDGARSVISERFQSRMNMFNLTFPDWGTVNYIFNTILSSHFEQYGFNEDVLQTAVSLTQASSELYQDMIETFRPTPSKCHYVFNLRDIAKVTQGIMQSMPNEYETDMAMVSLWVHESMRVFHDRLNDEPDRKRFVQIVSQKLESTFDTTWETLFSDENTFPLYGRFLGEPIFADTKSKGDSKEDDDDDNSNMFCIQAYQNLTRKRKVLKTKMLEALSALNEDPTAAKPGNLVLFQQAVTHVARICRVIAQPRGCALLAGVGGSGRRSLCKLSSYICEYKCFQIQTSQRYRQQDFYEDLKLLYTQTGVDRKPTAFLFSDTQLIEESFLEDINNILNSGEVPGLFPDDELVPILEDIKKDAIKEGRRTTQEALYAYLIERVRENLHVLLCLSPVGDAFRNRTRMYPALINCCTINWFPPWPEEALCEVAEQFLDDPLYNELKLDTKITKVLPKVFCTMHTKAADLSTKMLEEMKRANYITPTKYLDLVKTYIALVAEKTKAITAMASKLQNGLGKLQATQEQVAELEIVLKEQGKIVDAERVKCDKLNEVIAEQQREASIQKAKVEEETAKSQGDVDRCAKLEVLAKTELGKAMPALTAAQLALQKLSKNAISEVKAYKQPPEYVEKVMRAVMILLGQEPSWSGAKRVMGQANFVEQLRGYDKDNIKSSILKKIKSIRKDENFNPEFVGKISVAAGAMCDWVCAMDVYAEVFKKVKPLQDKLEASQKELNYKQAGLRAVQAELKKVEEKVAGLMAKFKDAEAKKNALQQKKNALELKKERAMKLISGLSGEKTRWEASIIEYEKSLVNLPGDVASAAGFLTYAGPFDTAYRAELTQGFAAGLVELPEGTYSEQKEGFAKKFLVEPTVLRQWNIWGLPVDDFSAENGVIATRTKRWPLMIDPQEQAKKWIINMEKSKRLVEVKVGQKNFMQPIETAILLGTPVLLKDVGEDIPSALDPLLMRKVDDKSPTIMINDKDLSYNETFMLYITSKLSNPHYLPETSIKTTLINFIVKPEGLEEQLLGIVVNKEKPELELKNAELIVEMARNKKRLVDLEDQILDLLKKADSKTILDDEKLINTLGNSKTTSDQVKIQIQASEKTSQMINDSRNQYRAAAVRASVLFFVLNDLARVDPMYQFSLTWYADLFKNSIENSRVKRKVKRKAKVSISKRVRDLNSYHTESVYQTVTGSLFERHKLLFSFQICTSILKQEGKLHANEFTFFLRGGIVLDRKKRGPNPCSEWLSEEAWDNVSELDKLGTVFEGFSSSFEQMASEWRDWYQSDMKGGLPPEKKDMPGELMNEGTDAEKAFRKMLIVRCLRPDRLNYAVSLYVGSMLGKQYTEPPPFDLSKTFDASKPYMPVVFVLSPGSDPVQMLNDLAREKKVELRQVALGQGQAPIAERLFEEGVTHGYWVLLANCHLSIKWLPVLENKVMELRERKGVHPDFRLWLSSDPTPEFPIALLQSSIKVTTEPPSGLRSIMLSMYKYIPEDKFDKMDSKSGGGLCNKPVRYKALLFALAFFHSVLVERKKFLTLGWNVPYAFNDSDFLVCDNLLRYYLDESDETPLEALKYLIAQALYGGRVTDEIDRRLLGVYIEQYFTVNTIAVKRFHLSTNKTFYRVPEAGKYKSYIDYIQSLPAPGSDPPEAFGQHPNADVTMQQEGAKLLLDTVMSLQTRASGGGGTSDEKFVLDLAKNLQDRVPPLFNRERVEKKFASDQSPLKTVLLQEIDRYNVILATVEKSLRDLQDGIRGLIVISEDLEVVFDCLLKNKVPPTWRKGYYSLKPLSSWITDLQRRILQLSTWVAKGPPKVFWLSGFTFPNGFLTALLQTSARQNGVPIDSLGWEFLVQKEDEKQIQGPAREGAYIKGFFLEGAQWDMENWHLAEPLPMQLYSELPIINFKPVDSKKVRNKGMYACPVYRYPIRTGTRENPSYVLNVMLKLPSPEADKMKSSQDYWIKRGTAILLSLST